MVVDIVDSREGGGFLSQLERNGHVQIGDVVNHKKFFSTRADCRSVRDKELSLSEVCVEVLNLGTWLSIGREIQPQFLM